MMAVRGDERTAGKFAEGNLEMCKETPKEDVKQKLESAA
jgi:hypothetical protein